MIKFVYFDVGGVVIKDFSGTNKWQQLKDSISVKPQQSKDFDEVFGKFESEVCVGEDVENFVPIMRNDFGLEFPQDYSFLADFVDRFERNESVWPLITKSKNNGFKVGLLTNMYPNMLDQINQKNLMPEVKWGVVIDSSIERVRKPQVEIFQLAKVKSGFQKDEILFVENSVSHVEAAKEFGWQTFLYNPIDTDKSNKELEMLLRLD